jgi:hypothetical protein
MPFFEGIYIALGALRANKLRTFLTLLGNIVGVMSVIAVVSIIDGMNSYIRNEIADEGSGVFRVEQVNRLDMLSDFDAFQKSLHNPKITLSDLEFLRQRVPLAEYMDANRSTSARIQGRSENYPMLGKWNLQDGRHFAPQEVERSADVVVIGFDIADRIFPGVDPIDKSLKIAGRSYRIIGVLEKKAGVMGGNPNLFAVIPITSFMKEFGSQRSITISIKAADLERVSECVDQTRVAMRSLRHLGPRREDNFAIITSDNLLKLWLRHIYRADRDCIHKPGGGRHRHHEYHARIRDGKNERNRHSQSHRSHTTEYPLAISCGGHHALQRGRHFGHCVRLCDRGGDRLLLSPPLRNQALVHPGRFRGQLCSGTILRYLPGHAGGPPGPY